MWGTMSRRQQRCRKALQAVDVEKRNLSENQRNVVTGRYKQYVLEKRPEMGQDRPGSKQSKEKKRKARVKLSSESLE